MTRPLPLALLFLFFLWLGVNLSSTWMWLITVVALSALAALIVLMRYRGMYHGPNTLVDDFKTTSKAFLRDKGGEAERLEKLREVRSKEQEDDDEMDASEDDRGRAVRRRDNEADQA